MTLLAGFMLVITLVIWCVPDSPAGRVLRRRLVEKPLDGLAKLERHRLIYVVLLAGMMLAGGEMIVLLGPEILATYAVYLDAVLVTYALAAVAQTRAGLGQMKAIVGKVFRRPQARRKRPAMRPSGSGKPANDDEPAGMPKAA